MENKLLKKGVRVCMEASESDKLMNEYIKQLVLSEHRELVWKIVSYSLAFALALTWVPIFILVR